MKLDLQIQEFSMSEVSEKSSYDWPSRLQSDHRVREQAIEELRAYLIRGLSKSLTHRYGGRVDIDDVAQVALIKILGSLDTFAGRSKFETWAMSIATRIGISELRKRYYQTVSMGALTDTDRLEFDLSASDVPDSRFEERKNMIALLQELIERNLSPRQRIAIRGTLAGLPVELIAERMESNRNAIYKLVHDARLKLRGEFEKLGVTSEDMSILFSEGS